MGENRGLGAANLESFDPPLMMPYNEGELPEIEACAKVGGEIV